MIHYAYYIFWISLILIVYTYLGYGFLVYLLSKLRKTRKPLHYKTDEEFPPATLIVAAYNEEDFIEKKIENTLKLDYPEGKLKLLFVTDGSDDRTPEIIKKYPEIELHHQPERRGKINAVNRIMKKVTTPIVVFSDANTFLNTKVLRKLIRHYKNPEVGGVAGEKRVLKNDQDNAAGTGEGFYWKYESFLKKKDSDLSSVMGAAGELFSVRTPLFEPPEANMVIEDFYISMKIVSKGFQFVYEPDAYAIETASASIAEEWKRKVRIAAGGFQAIVKLKGLLNFFRYGIISFQYISHRVLRWTLAPLALLTVLISNIILATTGDVLYQGLLAAQILFYALALLGYVFRNKGVTIKGFFVPFYFIVMNLSVYKGFFRFLFGKQSVIWEKARRA